MNSNPLSLNVSAAAIRRFYTVLFAGSILLILVTALTDLKSSIVANIIGLQLDLKLEGNFAVWYSSTVLLLAGMGALAIGARTSTHFKKDPFSPYLWMIIAFAFVGLSMDETAQLHEQAGVLFTKHFGSVPFLTEGGFPVFAWLLALLPLIVMFVGCMLSAARWLRINPLSRKLVFSALICWIGVLCAEFFQAQLARWSWQRSLQGVLEEGLELTGATLFVVAFVEFLRTSNRAPSADEAPMVPTTRDLQLSEVVLPFRESDRDRASEKQ